MPISESQPNLSPFSGHDGSRDAVKPAKVLGSVPCRDVSVPFAAPLFVRDATVAACVRNRPLCVPMVQRLRHVPQVFYSVICTVAVDVINRLLRPRTVEDRPRHSVGKVLLIVNGTNTVTVLREAMKGLFASSSRVPPLAGPKAGKPLNSSRFPGKRAGDGIVVDKFSQLIWADVLLMHRRCVSLCCCGEQNITAPVARQPERLYGMMRETREGKFA